VSKTSVGGKIGEEEETQFSSAGSRWVTQAASLAILMLQTTSLTVFMRMSRTSSTQGQLSLYVSSTAVCLVELIKLGISIVLYVFLEKGNLVHVFDSLKSLRNWRFAIPAGLYVGQNNLQYVALSFLPATLYQLFIQLKIPAAALVSERMLERRHTAIQWASIFSLAAGVGMVQLSLLTAVGGGGGKVASTTALTFGLCTVLLSCITSGVAGVYSEKLVKSSSSKLWDLNIQMSAFGLLLAIIVALKDIHLIIRNGGILFGYSPVVWATILLHAFGGLIIAYVVKNTSSVIKGFAQSGSVILSSLISHFFLKESLKSSPLFILGASLVCASAIVFAANPGNQIPASTSKK